MQIIFNVIYISIIDDKDYPLIKYSINTAEGHSNIIQTTEQMTLDLMEDSNYIIVKFINELSKE